MEIGKPNFWHLQTHIDAVTQMIKADEIQIALKMLDDVPAWYREHYPKELTDIRQTLYKNLYSTIEYSSDEEELEFSKKPEIAIAQWGSVYCHPRSEILTNELMIKNRDGIVPLIIDLGSSHGNLPLGLKSLGLQFNYKGLAPNHRTTQHLKEFLGDIWADKPLLDQPVWFTCFEVLEHVMDVDSLIIDALKAHDSYDQVFWSTPLGCLYGGLDNWATRRLGHVRGWTSKEFLDFVQKHFPGYNWKHYLSHSQVLHGVKA